jgi:phenylacetate-CoA ligase
MLLLPFLKQVYLQRKNLSLTKQQIQDLQQRKFFKLVAYVSKHSPYYQKIIKQYKIDIQNCKPEDFPILTKETLIREFDNIVTDKQITKAKLAKFFERSKHPQDLFLNKYIAIHTSGSSGMIGYYLYSVQEFIQGTASSARAANPKLLQKIAYVGAIKGHFAGITMVTTAKKLPFLYKEVHCFDINAPFSDIITELNKLQPTIVIGYAFALKKLAEAQQKGNLTIKPRILQSGGEPLSSEDKKYIQQIFHVPVINIYASSEHLFMGIGKDSFGGMYLMEDNLYFEMIPDKTYVTNLYNYTLPLIRYQMTDRLQPMQDKKKLMPFTKVKDIVGRNEYVPIFLNDRGEEDFISPILLVELYIPQVTKFQIHFVNKRNFQFKACVEDGLTTREKEKTIKNITEVLQNILREKNMEKVKFSIELVDHLWVDPKTGKFRLITI